MPEFVPDPAGPRIDAENFLAAVLETVAQPIWVVDPDDRIQFANAAAITALGYGSADQLAGRRSHETIHYRHPDGTPYPASECRLLLPRVTGERVASDLDWFVRRDGSMVPVSYVSAPMEMPAGRGAVVAFTDIEERMRAEQVLREHDAVLAAREASLRRIALMVAGGATSPEVLAAIAREVAQVLDVALVLIWRYQTGRSASVLGEWSDRPHPFRVGSVWPVEERTAAALLPDLDHAARIEDFGKVGGAIPDVMHEIGIRAGAGAAIVIDGDLWGVMGVGVAEPAPLKEHVEDRLAAFTELLATAISNTHSRAELARLAAEQASLRRVATLVARESPPAEIFAAVTEELGRLLEVAATRLVRYEDGAATVVASWGRSADTVPVGTHLPVSGRDVISLVARTGRPARLDDCAEATGLAASDGPGPDPRGAVGGPIVVAGRLWGAMVVSARPADPLRAGAEEWIEKFGELVATAIANVQARADLAASRARIVAATDEERRRVVRDLHDGAQQRLVQAIITLKLAQQALPDDPGPASALVTEALDIAEHANDELRELVHGILPAVLRHGGLPAGVTALAARMPVPVETDVDLGRLPDAVEATAYFVVAEALTNVAKHARARHASVSARIEDGTLRIRVRDDGAGGARPDGSGLLGLADRLAALDGALRIESPADGGTLVTADVPLSG